MRVNYVLLANLAYLLARANSKLIPAGSVVTKKIVFTSPDTTEAIEGVYLQHGKNTYVIIRLSGVEDLSTKITTEDYSASHDKEERHARVNADTMAKLKQQLPGEHYSWWNYFLRKLFNKMTPEQYRFDK
ncbi:hypothetical protein PPTG_14286 [Phytophthora nicotianae INRA-310]|uniref:RxLR effector protein n=1 Tax=Phytophthora nicotianae (strain INRA-310) TaxID=761204 RepID=W2PY49_PHYN3|nr:hypothetical protein PPTG_14286 [Phytophthora nicotianae INRA-310]ETN05586.1 hypothetical protein PPTG_14286 [Phytophthora nicotianae INRA-310]